MNTLLRSLPLALSLLATPLAAQDDAPEPRRVAAADLALRLVPYPDDFDAGTLGPLVATLTEELAVSRTGQQVSRTLNLDSTPDGWLIMDSRDRVDAIEQALTTALASLREGRSHADRAELELRTWQPRHVEVSRLAALLEPLRREVRTPAGPGAASGTQLNISVQDEPALLLLQDTPGQLDRMVGLLERFDRAAPQVVVSCWVLGPADEAGAAPPVPAELQEHLARLVPWMQPRVLATGLLRTTVVAGAERRMHGTWSSARGAGDRQFELNLLLGSLDEAGRQLGLQRVEFRATDGQGFDTSVVLGLDEYTVLGMAGERPLLVALRVAPAGN